MRLLASVRPPWQVVAHLEAAVRPEWDRTPNGAMRWIRPAHWRIHLAGFGDVVKADVPALCEVLAERIAELEPPALSLSGIETDAEHADSLWAGVVGDVTTIAHIAESIQQWVIPFGFVLDRRAYRPRIYLGRTAGVSEDDCIESIVGRLRAYRGRRWVVEAVTLGHEIPASTDRNAGFAVVHQAYFAHMSGGSSA